MKNRKITVICILLIAISLVLISSVCFADQSFNETSAINKLVGSQIEIENLNNFFKNEYLSEYDNQSIRVIVKYNEPINSIQEDLKNLNVECDVNYNFDNLFYGQSINIKVKDLLSLTKLSYIKSVSICAEYYSLYNYSSQSNTNGGIIANESSYNGEGMVVCVIDNAFDTSHIAFSNIDSVEDTLNILNNEDLYKLNAYKISNVTAQELYLSKKIPFAYDYAEGDTNLYEEANHGTHVAGIIGGDSSEVSGVVKKAQLVLMKVGDKQGAMYTDTILKALEDCKILNVDTINMSLGSNGGFSYNKDDVLCESLEQLKNIGIDIVCAAGNSYTSSFGSENGDLAYYENMDNGSIASPASYTSTYSIANAQEINYLTINENKFYLSDGYYTKTQKYGNYFDDYVKYIEDNSILENKLEYVLLEKEELLLGKEEDYEGFNVENKIVVVKRGEITFTQKLETAKNKGAIGIIVINTSQSLTTAALDNEYSIPFALGSINILDILKENAVNGVGEIKIDKTNKKTIINESSSQGVLSDFSLGLDLSAYGTNVYSLGLNQSYEEMTGTSMAAPNASGAITSVKQFVKDKFTSIQDKTEISNIALKLLMSNTKLMTQLNDIEYSPRVQGAGLIDLERALSSYAYISVDDCNKTKIEIKEDVSKTNPITLKFNIVNKSTLDKTYSLDVICLTEMLTKDNLMSGLSEKLDIEIVNNPGEISVAANSETEVSIEVKLTDKTIEKLKTYTKGTYIDGFIKLNEIGKEYSLNCPFISYYGDWNKLEILDKTAYEVDEENTPYVRASTSYGIYAGAYYMPLGQFAYKVDEDVEELVPQAKEEYASLSIYSSAMYSLGYIQLGLLRNAEYITVDVIDNMTNKVVYTSDHSYIPKTAYLSSIASMYGGDLFEEISPYSLGLDNNKNYTVKVNIYKDYNENEQNEVTGTYEQDFTVDFEAPVIKDIKYSSDKTKATLSIYDNNYPQALLVCTGKGTTATNVSLYVEKVHPVVADEKSQLITMEIDISEAMKNATNGYLYYYVVDYAFNYAIYYDKSPLNGGMGSTPSGSNKPATSTSIKTQNLSFKVDSVKINVNEEIDLSISDYLQNYDLNNKYTWTSSNKDIVAIENGKITGLSQGVGVIEVTDGQSSASIIVKVVKEKEFEAKEFESAIVSGYSVINSLDKDLVFGLDVQKQTIELAPNEAFKFNFEYVPYNYNYIENPPTIEVIKNEDLQNCIEINNQIISAKNSGETEIEIKIKGKLIKSYTIKVCESIYVDNKTLKACFDLTESIDLRSLDILAIASNAFYYAKNVKEIFLPTSTKIIYEKAFENVSSLQTINLENVTTIHKNAFVNCTSLNEVNLSGIVKLEEDVFNGCSNLNKVIFSNSAQLESAAISMSAFSNCERLSAFNIGGLDTKSIIVNDKLLITLDYANALETGFSIIGSGSFSNIKLEELTLDNITRIEKDAFKNNDTIKKITLNNVQYIGPYAFSGCKALESVEFNGSGTLYIGERAFAESAVKTMDFSNIETTFEDQVFFNCENLQYVNVGKVQDIGRYTFALAQKLVYVEFETGSKKVGENTFAMCTYNNKYYYHDALKYVSIPDTITKIDKYAFAYCSNLNFKDINLTNVEVIEEGAFIGTKINDEIVLQNIKKIDYAAFAESNISKIKIENLEGEIIIGELAFYKCEMLDTVQLPKREEVSIRIEKGAFYECIELYGVSYQANFFTLTKKQYGINFDRVTYVGDFAFEGCANLNKAILNNVEHIGYAAFANCEQLTTVEINSVKYLDDFAFYKANLAKINLPKTIEYIGESVFNDNENLQIQTLKEYDNIVVDYTSDNLPIIYTKLENGKLMLVYYPCESKDQEYEINNMTSYIGAYSFYNAKNLKAVIMNNIEEIGHGAFYKCENLKSVEIKGNIPELISSYNSDSSNTYCNFMQEIDSAEGLILIGDEQNIDKLKASYIYNEYFDFIISKSNENANYTKIADFVELIEEKEIENLSKDDITKIISAYDSLSQAEKDLLNSQAQLSEIKNKYSAITKINQSTQEQSGSKLGTQSGASNSLLNLTPTSVIVLFVLIGMLSLAITALLAWYFAQKAMNRKK